jgi:hypothetical protein
LYSLEIKCFTLLHGCQVLNFIKDNSHNLSNSSLSFSSAIYAASSECTFSTLEIVALHSFAVTGVGAGAGVGAGVGGTGPGVGGTGGTTQSIFRFHEYFLVKQALQFHNQFATFLVHFSLKEKSNGKLGKVTQAAFASD